MIKVNGKEIEFTQFPNEETNMNYLSFPEINKYTTKIVFKYENDGDLVKLLFVKEYLNTLVDKAHSFELTIYYMPYSRMDRSENGSPFTLKYIAKFINGMEFDSVTTIEPHSHVTNYLLNNTRANYINFELIEDVIKEVDFSVETDYIMFPDKGAAERYDKMEYANILVGEKVRNFETGRIESLDVIGEIKHIPRKVVIVDDLSSYGTTFVVSAKKLRKLGFNEVYLLVAHAENSVLKGELFDHIDKLFTTDSMLTEQNHWHNAKYESKLKMYKLEDLL